MRQKLTILSKCLLLTLAGLAMAQPPELANNFPMEAATNPEIQQSTYNNGVQINVDLPLQDPGPGGVAKEICGVTIFVQTTPGNPPTNFYTGSANPWGSPSAIVEVPPGSGYYVITFGGVNGPCFKTTDSIFSTKNGKRVFHLGFRVTGVDWEILFNASEDEYNVGYITHYTDGSYFGYGLPGHSSNGQGQFGLAANAAAQIQNPQAASADFVDINNLRGEDLPELPWVNLEGFDRTVLSKGESVSVAIPESVMASPNSRVIVTYDIVDPVTGEFRANITLDFPKR